MRFGQAVRVLSLSAFIGTIILVIVDGMPWMDALYFMVTALSTVGVGDVAPKTVVGRLVSTLLTFITISSWLAMPRMIAEQGSLAKQRLVTFLIFSLLWFAHRCNLERLSVSDAVWLAVALATGQGFGDVHLETRAGRASSPSMPRCCASCLVSRPRRPCCPGRGGAFALAASHRRRTSYTRFERRVWVRQSFGRLAGGPTALERSCRSWTTPRIRFGAKLDSEGSRLGF
eukprot:TRINITY_DN18312_c0_g1_i2.p1 TRINITY_DN18312_c0_g1~~TRINITY_DN18312_c0_g1_i2.p1  ORF type:complete len:248 (-),score=21.89 TRINITY_DN18312_c0_g1_i2:45-734(-)